MNKQQKKQSFLKEDCLNIAFFLIIIGVIIGVQPLLKLNLRAETGEPQPDPAFLLEEKLVIIQENTLLGTATPVDLEYEVVQKIKVVITGYSSTPWETDGNPFITASGTWVREGVVANNLLPFGTKIKIPEIYGDKIFVVEDRMNWKKGNYHIDVWLPDYWQALNFGAKRTYIEVLES